MKVVRQAKGAHFPMLPMLVCLDDGDDILVDKPVMLLGRVEEADIRLISPLISRRHCCLAQVESSLGIRDLGSMNGIHVNGKRRDFALLDAGDEVRIGGLHYRMEWMATIETRLPTAKADSARVEDALPAKPGDADPDAQQGDEKLNLADALA